jgi:hypothetical protein
MAAAVPLHAGTAQGQVGGCSKAGLHGELGEGVDGGWVGVAWGGLRAWLMGCVWFHASAAQRQTGGCSKVGRHGELGVKVFRSSWAWWLFLFRGGICQRMYAGKAEGTLEDAASCVGKVGCTGKAWFGPARQLQVPKLGM